MNEWIFILAETPLPKAFEWIPVVNSVILFGVIAGALIKYSSWRATEEQRKREQALEKKQLIITACEEFTNSPAYRASRDQRTREISGHEIHEAFSRRASTFVDSKVYEAELRSLRSDIARLGEDIKENTGTLNKISGQLGMASQEQKR